MGGSNESKIDGLRFHLNNGEVHVHDDNNKLKFVSALNNFKDEVKTAFEELTNIDGTYEIKGKTKVSLYIFKNKKMTHIFVANGKSVRKEIEIFARDCK